MLPAGTLAVFAAGAAAYVAYVAQLVLHAELTTPLAAALKVMPIVALAVGVATANGAPSPAYRRWMLAGLVLSGVGDVFLALTDSYFLAGLAAFLAAHLCYIGALAASGTALRLARALPVAAVATAYYAAVLQPAVQAPLQVPVALYVAAIATMVWRSAAGLGSGNAHARWAFAGAVLFFISDAVLAYNMFVAPLAFARVGTMVPYYAGQLGLAVSATVAGPQTKASVAVARK